MESQMLVSLAFSRSCGLYGLRRLGIDSGLTICPIYLRACFYLMFAFNDVRLSTDVCDSSLKHLKFFTHLHVLFFLAAKEYIYVYMAS